jgi:hypothetical protein
LTLVVTTFVLPLTALGASFEGPTFFPGGVAAPTGEKPESKLWFNAGSWWASMFSTAAAGYRIFRLDMDTQTWTDTGVALDNRANSKSDVLWDNGVNKLYVASRVFNTTAGCPPAQSPCESRLYRYSYDTATGTYSLDNPLPPAAPHFPVLINSLQTETLVLARDSTGKLWATWMQSGQVWLNRTDITFCPVGVVDPDRCWGTPFSLLRSIANPNLPQTAAANADDVSTIVAFTDSEGPKMGVVWTDQVADAVFFSVHRDGDSDTTWRLAETASQAAPAGVGLIADDHINVKTDPSGRVYVVAKTGRDPDIAGSNGELIVLFVRSAIADPNPPNQAPWSFHVVRRAGVMGTPEGDHTRPIVLIDEANDLIRVFSNATGGGPVYERTSPRCLNDECTISFPSVDAAPVIPGDPLNPVNNVTSTKQNVNAATGVAVVASSVTNTASNPGFYWSHVEVPTGPTVTIEATDNSAAENPVGIGTVTVTRTGDTSDALTVNYSIGGSAINGTDYTTLATSVVIPAGSATATITVTPVDDADVEADETVTVTLGPGGYSIGSPSSSTVTITSDDVLHTVSIVAADPTATEAGTTIGTFSVSRTGSTSAALIVNYTISGAATNTSDYATLSGSVVIPANSATATITVTPVDDLLVEGDETVILTLSGSPNYGIAAPGFATVTIVDRAVVTIVASDASASEAGPDLGAFTVSRTGPITAALTVFYDVGGTASAGSDYTPLEGSVVIPAGSATATITVLPIDDTLIEGNETVVLTLTPDAYLVGTPSSASVTLINNDLPTVTLAVTAAGATETGPIAGTISVSRNDPTSVDLTVRYSVGGTATNGADYTTLSGSVVIPAGASTVTITVIPIDDTLAEDDETVVLTLSLNAAYLVGVPSSATVTISSDDLPMVSIVAGAAANERGSIPGTLSVSRTGPTGSLLTVLYSVGGTATVGDDYTGLPGSVIIPAGSASAAVTVSPIDDTLVEGNETVVLSLSSDAAYRVGSPSSATVTISSDDLPTISIVASQAAAHEVGPTPGLFTVSRTNLTGTPLTVHYSVGGSGTVGSDYTTLSGSVVIPVGSATATITLTPINDILAEDDETVVLTLTPNAAYVLGAASSATVTISSEDLPQVSIVATDANATEAGPTPGTGTFTVSRTGGTGAPLTVLYGVGGTAATDGSDYTTLAGSVVIPVGSSTATITLTPIDDTLVESNETVVLTLGPDAAYVVGTPSSATVTIRSDDVPTISIVASATGADEVGPIPGTFTVSRTNLTSANLTVHYGVGGTAINGTDYATLPGSVVIPAGFSSVTITLTPLNDTLIEGDETAVVTLVPNAAYIVGAPSSGTVTISSDDLPRVNVAAPDPSASEAGSNTGTFRVSRTGPTATPLMVTYTLGGTATAGSDYAPLPASVVIPAGSAGISITVVPIDDTLLEADETVVLALAAGAAYVVGAASSATVTIISNEVRPTVSVAATDARATEAGLITGTFTVSRTGPTGAPLTVLYVVDGTATAGGDYTALPGSVIIPTGSTTATITVAPIDDTLVEVNERVRLTLAPDAAYAVSALSSATVRIISDDAPPTVSVAATDASASEVGPDTGTFTVSRTGSTEAPLTVLYGVSGTATGSDYATLSGSVVIPSGASTATITVTPTNDVLAEGDETVVVTVTANAAYTVVAPSSATLTISSDDAPDLVAAAVSDPPATRRLGGSFSVTHTVLNQGIAEAPASTTRYYLSTDTVRNPGDRRLTGNSSVPGLPAGAQSTRTRTLTIPVNTALGNYFLLACTDDTQVVTENDESNNCRASTTQVTVRP